MLTSRLMAKTLAKTLDAKMAQDIRILEIADLSVLADYFVICTASSNTHIKTLEGECERVMELEGERPHHIEGRMSGNWILMDFGVVVVHLFLKETREFYSIERLWSDAKEWNEADL